MNNAIKTTLAVKIILAVLLFLCLLKMPYGFYQFVRFVGLIGFSILAWQANQQGRQTEMLICCALALLFQPFFKIALGRQIMEYHRRSSRRLACFIAFQKAQSKQNLKNNPAPDSWSVFQIFPLSSLNKPEEFL